LRNHEAGLELSVTVAVLVAHLHAGLHEGGRQRGPPRRFLGVNVMNLKIVSPKDWQDFIEIP
jgi:hypothetical protein